MVALKQNAVQLLLSPVLTFYDVKACWKYVNISWELFVHNGGEDFFEC